MKIRKRRGKVTVSHNGLRVVPELARSAFGFRLVSEEELVEAFTKDAEAARRVWGPMWEIRRMRRSLRSGRRFR